MTVFNPTVEPFEPHFIAKMGYWDDKGSKYLNGKGVIFDNEDL